VLEVDTDDVFMSMPDWSKADEISIHNYRSALEVLLGKISIPIKLFHANYCDVEAAKSIIDTFYDAVMSSIQTACLGNLPQKRFNPLADLVVPGWNELVLDKHQCARDAFREWAGIGKPRQGVEFDTMKRTRAQFKYALRFCKNHEEQLRADAYARSLSDNDYYRFWKDIQRSSNGKSTKFVNCVGGSVGDSNIACMWKCYFEELYNSVKVNDEKALFLGRLPSLSDAKSFELNVRDIVEACHKQKGGKAVGLDGVAMEAFVNGGNKLLVHICLLFNLFVKYGHLPDLFMQSVIVPLVKNKSGLLSDINNYRAIAVSTAVSKLFECTLSDSINGVLKNDSHQFGFKSGHSTSLCTNVLKRTVDYYTSRGSHVFTCFIDFSKAFDKVNYWKLFHMLLDDGVDVKIVRLLAYWYSKQKVCVRWNHTVSSFFSMGNGTRQGGVLSPSFFARYTWKLLTDIVYSGIGCNIGGMFINVLAYADDIVLIAPAWRAMQELLDMLFTLAMDIDMLININKTVCMVFAPKTASELFHKAFWLSEWVP
jgi:hypothetical protein